jgi:predicted RNase H-like HicB family nuclease
VVGEHTVLGQGATKDEALADLRNGVEGLVEYLKEQGLHIPSAEVVSIEVG